MGMICSLTCYLFSGFDFLLVSPTVSLQINGLKALKSQQKEKLFLRNLFRKTEIDHSGPSNFCDLEHPLHLPGAE